MKKLLQPIFAVALLFSAVTTQAQDYKNNIEHYTKQLESEAGKLIASGNVASADEMTPDFNPTGYDPVTLDLQKVKRKKLEPGKLYKKVAEATVIVSPAGHCSSESCDKIHTFPASGYIIDPEGVVVTNYHVIEGFISKYKKSPREAFVVMLWDGTTYPVKEIMSADKSNDLAVLKIDPKGRSLPALPVANKDAEIGDPVFVVSHPKGYFYAFSSGMVTDKFSQHYAGQSRNLLAISADYAAGSSGAAIIDQYGNVIGTVSYTKTLLHSNDESKTQMVIKGTIPASSLLRLVKEGNQDNS